jgi:hypothetical protein
LPIDGVTSDNLKACADLLTAKLEGKPVTHAGWNHGIKIREHSNQWYLTFYMGEDVGLREVEAALKGSRFSIPRDRLRLFGHVILEIDAKKTPQKELLAELDALDNVSITESKDKDDLILVTVDMPYPVEDGRREKLSIGWDKFRWNDFASDQSSSDNSITSRKLPSYGAVRDVVAKHNAKLHDIRWSTNYACRPLGAVAVDSDSVASAKRSP